MENVETVKSLSEFMSWTETTREKTESDYILLYRGHSDANYTLTPSVYRTNDKGESLRYAEHDLYEEMLRRDPIAFADDKTVFERLVRMQHHELPTRLLDLTHSPLIALYFACCGNHDSPDQKDGEVIFLPRARTQVDQPSDIPDVALAGIKKTVDLSKIVLEITNQFKSYFERKKSIKFDQRDLHKEFHKEFHSLLDNCLAILNTVINESIDLLVIVAGFQNIEMTMIPEFIQKWGGKLSSHPNSEVNFLKFQLDFNAQRENIISLLCNGLHIENNNHKNEIYKFFAQFTHFHFVHAPINNERIRRQQGAFVISPLGRTKHWSIKKTQEQIYQVRIDGSKKHAILKELAYLGITKSYVFPELTVLAEDVKRRYQPRADTFATS